MTKEPKPVDKLTKPELLALVKRLRARVTRLERQLAAATSAATRDEGEPLDLFPWEKD